MSYSEEKLLQFFGQLVGVAIRADVPIALDLLPCFWKSLKGEALSLDDLREADCITYNLTQKMLKVIGRNLLCVRIEYNRVQPYFHTGRYCGRLIAS